MYSAAILIQKILGLFFTQDLDQSQVQDIV